jgi:PKD repeat protein
MKLFHLFIAILCCHFSFAQDTARVLFIGNSYVATNDLPSAVTQLSNSLGDVIIGDSKLNGGFTFANHWNDPITYTKMNAQLWDYVVIQGQSQEPSFPTSQVNTQSLPYAVNLADSVYEVSNCTQAMYFMTWGRQNGDQQWDSINTFDKMNSRLRNAYLRIADSANACVAPVGVAWKYVRDNYPTINLYSGDGSHPSVEGTYLSACTFYASIFRKSPIGANYLMGLDPLVASQLQTAASLMVLDSLETWKLKPADSIVIAAFIGTQNGNQIQFTNQSYRADAYSWDFGDGGQSIEINPLHVYATPGSYNVQLIASSSCGADTAQTTFNVEVFSVEEKELNYSLHTLGNGVFTIQFDTQIVFDHLDFVSADGRQLYNQILLNANTDSNEITLNCSKISNGIYYLILEQDQQKQSIKISNF